LTGLIPHQAAAPSPNEQNLAPHWFWQDVNHSSLLHFLF